MCPTYMPTQTKNSLDADSGVSDRLDRPKLHCIAPSNPLSDQTRFDFLVHPSTILLSAVLGAKYCQYRKIIESRRIDAAKAGSPILIICPNRVM